MTETVTKKIPTINAVEGFDPAEFTRQLPNEDGSTSLYLDVKYRLLWFRLHRPQGKIVPDIVHVDEKSAVVSCKLYEDIPKRWSSNYKGIDDLLLSFIERRRITDSIFGRL